MKVRKTTAVANSTRWETANPMLEKTYNAANVEPRIYKAWEDGGAFKAGSGANEDADPYCIVIPPPNVTGSLHMGHALNNTLQDILIRYQRMQGRNVLWQPGMDHAGIATQMVVERQLQETQGKNKRELGRKAFVDRIWEWKAESGGMIFNQLRRLGASCDWSRERFTMDEGLSKAVIEVFVHLYEEGLIYKDKRLVNWDPKFHTAISDLEVEQIELKGKLWHFRYPIEDSDNRHIVVATTRPETVLGDTAVAVNPADTRYEDLVGKNAILPLVGRKIPIVADEYADMEAGSGAVKITPAHDFNDFEVGKRHELPMVLVMDRDASMYLKDNEDFLANVPESKELSKTIDAIHGQDRFKARQIVVEMFTDLGLLEQVEEHVHSVPHGDRSNVPIEPFLTDQWYVDAKTLAGPAIEAVQKNQTRFVPKNWEKTYFDWMNNIQPWCISRQLWWGHQIPAWYGPDGKIFVGKSEPNAVEAAEAHYGKKIQIGDEEEVRRKWENDTEETIWLYRDEDVLDTWFSSALWAFSTLGWPEQTSELKRYYPTSVLITGFDIIFFWVARMMMTGLHFLKEVPFDTVYIHALVRDEKGAKMSKSKGNVMDPLELMDKFSADALRFTLAAMAAQGRDIKMSESRVAGYRNFSTKLWNAARFVEMNDCAYNKEFDPNQLKMGVNKWIVAKLTRTTGELSTALDSYRFNDAAGAIYRFVWNIFCDWYLELTKPYFDDGSDAEKNEIRATTAWVLEEILKLLHPFMPFVTEELWQKVNISDSSQNPMLVNAKWPNHESVQIEAPTEIDWLTKLISEIRSVRVELNVPAAAKIPLALINADTQTMDRISANETMIKRLARVSEVTSADELPKGSAQLVVGDATVGLPLAEFVDLGAELTRQTKEMDKVEMEMNRINTRLKNPKFIANAKEEVIERDKENLAELNDRLEKIKQVMDRIKGASGNG